MCNVTTSDLDELVLNTIITVIGFSIKHQHETVIRVMPLNVSFTAGVSFITKTVSAELYKQVGMTLKEP